MYAFALSMWKQGRMAVEQLQQLVALGRITQEQANEIQSISQ